MEEVEEFKYLGFTFQRNGRYDKHLKDLRRKGICASKKVWGLCERICSGDIERRKKLYKYLVESVMTFGVEIWGWVERTELEAVQGNYYRWTLGLDFNTPRYIVRKEGDISKQKNEWGIRALKYEEKIRKLGEERLVKLCWREKQEEKEKDMYSEEREKFLNERGWSSVGYELEKERGTDMVKELERRGKDIETQEVDEKMRERKYNKRYKRIASKETPKYIKENRTIKVIRCKARVRCGNLEQENKYWRKEDERKCILCNKEKGNLEHLILDCEETKVEFERLGKMAQVIIRETLDEKTNKPVIEVWREVEKKMKKKKIEIEKEKQRERNERE